MDRSQGTLIAIALLLLWLSVAMVLPFLQYFLLAVLLAYVLTPLQRRLAPRVGERASAVLLVVVASVALVLPLVVVVRQTASEAVSLLERIREGEITLTQLEQYVAGITGVEVDLSEVLRSLGSELGSGGAFDNLLDVFGALTHVLIGVGLTLFLLFYFLKDGDRFLDWTLRTMPLPRRMQDQLYAELDTIFRAVLAGHVLVAIIQGIVAGIGMAVVGVPNVVFWTAVMIVLALLPIVGSFLVWGPAVVWLLAVGRTFAAAFLFAYGTVVVGVSDDYLRPIVVDRYAQVNPSVIIIGVLGGIYVIGVMGIFFGPIVIGSLRASLDVYRREYVQP